MKIFKTKNQHYVPFGRKVILTEVFLKISHIELDENGVIPHGYYFIEVEDVPHKLDDIVPSLLSWEQVEQAEKVLSKFTNKSLKKAIHQRVEEFTRMKLQMEGTSNYEIPPTDWEIYVKPIIEKSDEENPTISAGTPTMDDSNTTDSTPNTD